MKLVVTDIDETLSIGNDISPEVVSACERLRKNGWDIMVATGRMLASSMHHVRATGTELPAIVYNGARVMDHRTRRPVFETPMDPGLAHEVLKAGWDCPVELQVVGDELAFCREDDHITGSYLTGSGITVEASCEAPFTPDQVFRVLFYGERKHILPLERKMKHSFGDRAEIMQAGEGYLDVLSPGVSKGSALRRWLDSLSERPEIVVAVGDHHNDVEMLKEADLAAAPLDATPEVLSVADIVMPSAFDAGFARLAEWLLRMDEERIPRAAGMPGNKLYV
ncbi:MAG: HAD family phosphatase [Synergistaceae bacterium]|nr:HAD family hydrolase [Synergistota bacterium]NLM71237.1 HAD family phosphatase [Synergistaceae bacterium]